MTRQFKKLGILLLILMMGFSSCVNLKHINDFSSSSLKSLKKFEEIDYSFQQSCSDNCRDEKIIDLDISGESCNCKINREADRMTLLIYKALSGYLKGLTQLSNNDLTHYKTDALTKALTQEEFGQTKIEEEQVEAYSKLSGILLNAFTDNYRKNNIRLFVKEANEPIKVLVAFLDFNLSSNLAGKLHVRKEKMKIYYFDLIKDPSLSTMEKRRAVQEYYDRLNNVENIEKAIISYTKGLRKISKGHQKLVDNINVLDKEEIKELLTQYSEDLEEIVSEFNKTKR